MASHYGATSLPVATSTGDDDAVSDPGRVTMLAFIAAVLEADVGDAWESVAPSEPICRVTHPHDPQQEDFSSSDLPALFAFRGDAKPQEFDDGNVGDESPIELLWVMPPAPAITQARRRAIQVGITRAIHRALGFLNGRHPSWVVAGDTDPFAAAYGSSVLTHGGFISATLDSVRAAEVKIETGGGPVDYAGVHISVTVREDFVPENLADPNASHITIRRDAATPTAPGQFDQVIDVAAS